MTSRNLPLINPYFDLYQEMRTLTPEQQLRMRKKLIWAFSWAIPHPEGIRELSQFSPIVELGAGSGYWAWLLEQAGARVITLDQEPDQPPQWKTSLKGDPSSLSEYSEWTLLLCWPPDQSPMACSALTHFLGSKLIYIGEWRGRTATGEFHDALEKNWKLTRTIQLPNWPNYSDKIYIFEKKCS